MTFDGNNNKDNLILWLLRSNGELLTQINTLESKINILELKIHNSTIANPSQAQLNNKDNQI